MEDMNWAAWCGRMHVHGEDTPVKDYPLGYGQIVIEPVVDEAPDRAIPVPLCRDCVKEFLEWWTPFWSGVSFEKALEDAEAHEREHQEAVHERLSMLLGAVAGDDIGEEVERHLAERIPDEE